MMDYIAYISSDIKMMGEVIKIRAVNDSEAFRLSVLYAKSKNEIDKSDWFVESVHEGTYTSKGKLVWDLMLNG